MAAELLPEELWVEIKPLLPPPTPPSSKGGRPPVDNRAALRGIIFVLRSGIAWQMLPTEAFGVSGSSCWRRLSEWTKLGIWPELHRRLLNRLGKLGGPTSGTRWWTASRSGPSKGGAHRPEPNGPRQTGLQTPCADRGRRRAAGGPDHARQRPRPGAVAGAAGSTPRRPGPAREAATQPRGPPGRPRLRHQEDDRAGRGHGHREPPGPARRRHARQRAGRAALRGRAFPGVLQPLPTPPALLRTNRGALPSPPRTGRLLARLLPSQTVPTIVLKQPL